MKAGAFWGSCAVYQGGFPTVKGRFRKFQRSNHHTDISVKQIVRIFRTCLTACLNSGVNLKILSLTWGTLHLEGFWWSDSSSGIDYSSKEYFHWISVIRLPEFITRKDFDWAVKTATEKKKLPCSLAEFLTIDEGLCVQILHTGSYDDEPETMAKMDEYIQEKGYENDMNAKRRHHEIYLSDPRKTAPEKLKTIIRHPIRKKED